MEPPSPMQALGVNLFLSRFINRIYSSQRRFHVLIEERVNDK